jgi:hypothetical protein
MDSIFQSILTFQKLLLNQDVPSIVIGGISVAAWGEPRLTRDVDLKVLLSRQEADRLLDILSTNYQHLIANPREALLKHALIFIQDSLGTRLNLLLADTPYDVTAIQRGLDVEIQPDIVIRLCSPEDLIIYKLISTRLRDHDDARSVIRRQGDTLDDEYVIDWLQQFEVALDDSTLVEVYQALRSEHKRGK